MQSAIAFSPSLSLSTDPRKLSGRSFNPLPLARRQFSNDSVSFSLSRKLSPISCSLKQNGWVSGPNPANPEPQSDGVVVRATAESAGAAETPKSKSVRDTLVLGSLFGLWYLFNIYFNIYNKQVVFSAFIVFPSIFCAFVFGSGVGFLLLLVGTVLITQL